MPIGSRPSAFAPTSRARARYAAMLAQQGIITDKDDRGDSGKRPFHGLSEMRGKLCVSYLP